MELMHKSIFAVALMGVALMSGCNNAKSPDSVANDVATAQHKEALAVADARNDAAKRVDSAAEKVNEKAGDLNNAQAKGAYRVALAKAEGDRQINLAKCDALAGIRIDVRIAPTPITKPPRPTRWRLRPIGCSE